jgi:hypothetical protein
VVPFVAWLKVHMFELLCIKALSILFARHVLQLFCGNNNNKVSSYVCCKTYNVIIWLHGARTLYVTYVCITLCIHNYSFFVIIWLHGTACERCILYKVLLLDLSLIDVVLYQSCPVALISCKNKIFSLICVWICFIVLAAV